MHVTNSDIVKMDNSTPLPAVNVANTDVFIHDSYGSLISVRMEKFEDWGKFNLHAMILLLISFNSSPSPSCNTRNDWNKLMLSDSGASFFSSLVEFVSIMIVWLETSRFVTVFRFLQWHGWLWIRQRNDYTRSVKTWTLKSSYRTATMTHTNITFDIQRWRPSKSECFHISVDLSFVDTSVGPSTAESWYQFIINGTSGMGTKLACGMNFSPRLIYPYSSINWIRLLAPLCA